MSGRRPCVDRPFAVHIGCTVKGDVRSPDALLRACHVRPACVPRPPGNDGLGSGQPLAGCASRERPGEEGHPLSQGRRLAVRAHQHLRQRCAGSQGDLHLGRCTAGSDTIRHPPCGRDGGYGGGKLRRGRGRSRERNEVEPIRQRSCQGHRQTTPFGNTLLRLLTLRTGRAGPRFLGEEHPALAEGRRGARAGEVLHEGGDNRAGTAQAP